MDANSPLVTLAQNLLVLPAEAVETLLVTYDGVAAMPGFSREDAVQILRETAGRCDDPARRERLERAAAAMAAGRSCAAAADARSAGMALAAVEPEWGDSSSDAEDEEEDDRYMADPPPALPHLQVRHFFSGLVVRSARDFADAGGRAVCEGDLIEVLAADAEGDGSVTLACIRRTLRIPNQDALRNTNNAWFQPVPSVDCLQDLWEAIDARLDGIDEDELDEDQLELLADIRDDVELCQDWLFAEGELGPPPQCASGPAVTKVFGKNDAMTAWVPLLYAGVRAILEP